MSSSVVDSWGLAAKEKSTSSALPQSFVRLHSIQQQSAVAPSPFPERLATTFLKAAAFDWLDLEREVVALHLEVVEEHRLRLADWNRRSDLALALGS